MPEKKVAKKKFFILMKASDINLNTKVFEINIGNKKSKTIVLVAYFFNGN